MNVRAYELIEQARQSHRNGCPLSAIDFYEQALQLIREDNPEPTQVEAEVLNDLGGAYHSYGDLVSAGHAYRASLMIREGIDDAGEGKVLNNLGVVYATEGCTEEAEVCFQRSLSIKRKLGDRRGEQQTLGNLAKLKGTV